MAHFGPTRKSRSTHLARQLPGRETVRIASGALDSCGTQFTYSMTSSARASRFRGMLAERLCGLEVDDKFEFSRKLNGKVARLRAAQNAIDIGGGTTKVVYQVG